MTARRLTSGTTALGLLLLALLGTAVLANPASAAEKVITITPDGVSPKVLTVAAGDTVKFVTDDRSFAYRAVSTSSNWSFDSGPLGLLDGEYVVPDRITDSGTYTYRVAQDAPFAGSVVLPAPVRPGASPVAPKPSAAPKPSPATSSPAPSPAATGGTGTTGTPPIAGGFGTVDSLPSPASGGDGVALPPALAPPLPLPGETAGPEPATAPVPTAAALAEPAVPGDLAGAPSSRGLGLPAALAVVLAAGTASLIVRLLLAEPAARRARTGMAAPAPAVTVD